VDFAVVEANPRVFYAASATGGLWKTVNHGISFTPVFDGQPDFAIGAVALAQSRPEVIYVGTGEANNSRSTYGGNGMYKSVDGGRTWTKAGLPNAGRIGRIVVHPKNPDIVWCSAPWTESLGHLDDAETSTRRKELGDRPAAPRATGGAARPALPGTRLSKSETSGMLSPAAGRRAGGLR
jgi:hypothetical protein